MKQRSQFVIAPRLASFLFAATLGFALLGLAQCRMVGDRVTGIDVSGAPSYQIEGCIRACQDTFKRCREAEEERHRAALRECDGLPTASEREACRTAEESRPQTRKDACQSAMVECKRDCRYQEGSGSGGR